MRRGGVTEHIHNTGYGYELISIACIFCDVGKYPRDKYPRGCFPLLCGGVKMIYLDNGATSFPKPPEVTEAIVTAVTDYCANPGRAGHVMAARTAEGVFRARDSIAELFSIEDPARIVFTKNCTESLNLALKGLLRPGDHVITTSMEHNSVIRPYHRIVFHRRGYHVISRPQQPFESQIQRFRAVLREYYPCRIFYGKKLSYGIPCPEHSFGCPGCHDMPCSAGICAVIRNRGHDGFRHLRRFRKGCSSVIKIYHLHTSA